MNFIRVFISSGFNSLQRRRTGHVQVPCIHSDKVILLLMMMIIIMMMMIKVLIDALILSHCLGLLLLQYTVNYLM